MEVLIRLKLDHKRIFCIDLNCIAYLLKSPTGIVLRKVRPLQGLETIFFIIVNYGEGKLGG